MRKKLIYNKKLRFNRLHNEFLLSIPSKIRDKMDLEEGDIVEVEYKEESLIVKKIKKDA